MACQCTHLALNKLSELQEKARLKVLSAVDWQDRSYWEGYVKAIADAKKALESETI